MAASARGARLASIVTLLGLAALALAAVHASPGVALLASGPRHAVGAPCPAGPRHAAAAPAEGRAAWDSCATRAPATPPPGASGSTAWWQRQLGAFLGCVAAAGLLLGAGGAPAAAESSMSAVAPCLFKNCQKELAKCVLNPNCAANLTCIIACSNSPDEKTEKTCQINCGDNFENDVVGEFNACALSSKKCVPQRPDTGPMPGEVAWDPVKGRYPLPPDDAVVTKFDVSQMTGRWYITAGLNPLFDTFDCQAHFFEGKKAEGNQQGKLVGKINWRIQEPDGEFLTKSTVQNFIQVKPGMLENHDNEYLHYQDDWFILDYDNMDDPNAGWVLVYYRGRNDAWAGYGGGTLYSRSKTIPPQILDRVKAACDKIKMPYDAFWKATDNSCPANPDPVQARASFAKKLLAQGELSAEEQLTYLARSAKSEIDKDERWAFESAIRIEKMTEKLVKTEADQLVKIEKAAEQELVKDEQAVEQVLKKFLSTLGVKIPGW